MQISCFEQKIKNNLQNFCERRTKSLTIESTTFVSPNLWWHHCATGVLSAWLYFRNFVIYRGDWLSIKFCENDSFRKLFLFFENTFQYLGGTSQDISVSHFDSRRSLSSANRRRIVGDLPSFCQLYSALWSAWQEDPNDLQECCAMARTSCASL